MLTFLIPAFDHLYIGPAIHGDEAEEGEHGDLQVRPALRVHFAEQVVPHDGKQEHEEQQQQDDVDDPLADRVDQCRHQHLESYRDVYMGCGEKVGKSEGKFIR